MELKQRILQQVQVYANDNTLTLESKVGDIKLDSLDIMDMVLELEDLNDVVISDGDLASFNTIDDLVNHIIKHRNFGY